MGTDDSRHARSAFHDRVVATGIVAAAVVVTAVLLNPTLFGRSPSDFDLTAGLIELALFPASLFTAAILLAFGERSTTIAGFAVIAAAGLTLCQPFGIVVGDEVTAAELQAGTVIHEGDGVPLRAAFPLLRITAYTAETPSVDATSRDAKVRTLLIPGLLSHATTLASGTVVGDEMQLRRLPDGDLATAFVPKTGTEPVSASRLSYGVASRLGVLYWVLAILLVALGAWRRHRKHGAEIAAIGST